MEEIKKILSECDPIGAGYPLSLNEYSQYIPKIKFLMYDEEKLKLFLVGILNHVGLDYDPNDIRQQKDIDVVVEKIMMLR
jgi:hypothetical protein